MSPPKDTTLAIPSILYLPPIQLGPGADDHNPREDDDPGYHSEPESSSSSVSIAASIDFPSYHGTRCYHTFQQGRYKFPNDVREQDVEEMKHVAALRVLNGRLHLSPLNHPQSIVDVGTGTGSWAIEMAQNYPSARVVGTDLSPIQPRYVPPNIQFYVDDAEAEWVEDPESLDFVFLRNMALGIRDWPIMLHQAYEALKPGGWIEIQDFHWEPGCDDDSIPKDWAPSILAQQVADALARSEVDPYISTELPSLLTRAGFTAMEPVVSNVPVGSWPKDQTSKSLGEQMRRIMMDGAHGFAFLPLRDDLGWNPETIDMFLIQVLQALSDPRVHSHVTFHCVYAQKPLRHGHRAT